MRSFAAFLLHDRRNSSCTAGVWGSLISAKFEGITKELLDEREKHKAKQNAHALECQAHVATREELDSTRARFEDAQYNFEDAQEQVALLSTQLEDALDRESHLKRTIEDMLVQWEEDGEEVRAMLDNQKGKRETIRRK